jgi:hypothetical protein
MFLDQERSALKANGASHHAVLNLRYFMRTVACARGPLNGTLCSVSSSHPMQPVDPGDVQSLLAGRFPGLSS